MNGLSAWKQVNLAAVRRNYSSLCKLAAPAAVMPVLKGNAYGHGLVEVGRCLDAAGASLIGVATTGEAQQLRRNGISAELFLLYGPEPAEAKTVVQEGLTSAVWRADQVRSLASAARRIGQRPPVHILVDASSNWLGVRQADLDRFCKLLQGSGLPVQGICTHLWNVDFFDDCYRRFRAAAETVQRYFPGATLLHIANSKALLTEPRSYLGLVRPGIALFGSGEYPGLEEALSIRAKLLTVTRLAPGDAFGYGQGKTESERVVGILAAGYSHGIDPRLIRGGRVLFGTASCPVLSTGMGMTVVDLSGHSPLPQPGESAYLLGGQGSERISVGEVAEVLGCTPYEVYTRFCAALPLCYLD